MVGMASTTLYSHSGSVAVPSRILWKYNHMRNRLKAGQAACCNIPRVAWERQMSAPELRSRPALTPQIRLLDTHSRACSRSFLLKINFADKENIVCFMFDRFLGKYP